MRDQQISRRIWWGGSVPESYGYDTIKDTSLVVLAGPMALLVGWAKGRQAERREVTNWAGLKGMKKLAVCPKLRKYFVNVFNYNV